MADEQEYNKEDARKYLGVSLRTLQRLTARNAGDKDKIPCHTKRGTKGDETWYFKRDLDAFLTKRNPAVQLPALPPVVSHDTPPDTALTTRSGDFVAAIMAALEDRRQNDDKFLTLHEASEHFGLSLAVLKRAVAQEELKLYPVGRRGAKVLRLSEIRGFIRNLKS